MEHDPDLSDCPCFGPSSAEAEAWRMCYLLRNESDYAKASTAKAPMELRFVDRGHAVRAMRCFMTVKTGHGTTGPIGSSVCPFLAK